MEKIYAHIDDGVSANPDFGGCHFVAGLLGMRLGTYPQAARAFFLAMERGFEVRNCRQNLALALLMWGEQGIRDEDMDYGQIRGLLEDARDRFDVLRNDVRFSEEERSSFRRSWIRAMAALVVAHQTVGERDQAEAILKHLTLIDPDDPLHWLNLGKIYGSYFRWEEAIAAHQKALEKSRDPKWAEPHLRIACILSSLGEYEEADRHFDACRGGRVDQWELEYWFGRHLSRQRDLEGAVDSFEAAVSLDPDRTEAYYYLHQALLQLRRPAEAAKWQLLQQALEERRK